MNYDISLYKTSAQDNIRETLLESLEAHRTRTYEIDDQTFLGLFGSDFHRSRQLITQPAVVGG